MNNSRLVASLAAALAVGAVGGAGITASMAQPKPNTLQLQNMQLTRGPALDDGGIEWSVRSCARELAADAGIVGEPCWFSAVPDLTVKGLADNVLAQKL